ncbi:unnamed protein product [Bubo scandiacus]
MAPAPAPVPAPGAWLALLVAALICASVRGDGDPPDPIYLPADLEVLGVPEYYRLQRVDQDLPANTSLHARRETYLLLRHDSATQPLVQATYPPFSTRQEVPMETPLGRDGSVPWAIRAVSLESAVSPAEPFARVLFHLQGPDWLPREQEHPGEKEHPGVREHPRGQEHPRERDLPCVTLHAHHRGRVARGTCRLQAPLGVCVVELEIPPRWFSPASPTPRSRRRAAEPPGRPEPPEPVELHYGVVGPGECGRAGGRERSRGGEARRYLGTLELRASEPARRQEVRLDDKVLLRVPDATLRPGQRFTATVALRHNFTADQLTLRIKAKKGLQVVGARPGVPTAWSTQLERTRGPKHSTVVVTCRRSEDARGGWRAADSAAFLHLDLAVENGTGGLAPARPLTWQVEYPGQDPEAQKDKLVWEIQVSERDVRALVPLVQRGGGVAELTEPLGCESADKQVLQVSDACDAVFVGGKESRGARGARVDFWARRLHASLRFTVWAPLLPLRVQLGDTTLEQVRGWRLPGGPESAPAEAEDTGEEAERRARGCRPQYQRTALRVLAHFVAHPLDGGRHLTYLPSPEWLLDVTHLVANRTWVQDPRVASLEGGTVVVGREPGVTSVEVRSPLSDSILGEQMLVVSEEKVTVTELRARVVSGLALSLRAELGHPGLVTATAQGTATLRAPKQEATLSVWLSFSDRTLAPLELYGWQDAALTVTSLDPTVATVGGSPGVSATRPWVVAEGPGRGALLQLSLHPLDAWVVPPSTPTPGAPLPRKEGVTPGGGRRKRVEFVTFASPRVPEEPPQPAPNVQSILVASEDDIRWVCEDMGLRDPEELRSYMERIRGSS